MDLDKLRLEAQELDRLDPLSHFRARFKVSDESLIYLDGNSLGRLVLQGALDAARAVEAEWGESLVRGWNEGWYERATVIGGKIARLIGAEEGEVVVSDSTSVNLFKLACAALKAKPSGAIITDTANFPSDLYILQGACKWLGRESDLVVVSGEEQIHYALQGVEDVALLTLSHVCFKSGFLYDAKDLTDWTHQRGGLCLWDLSHSAGSVPVELGKWGVDLAVGCTYKYLNGGPGAPAFLYVSRKLQDRLENPICGWFGQHDPFGFGTTYRPAPGIAKFLVGTPPVLSLTPIEAGVDVLIEAGLAAVRQKSIAMTDLLIRGWETGLKPLGVELETPRDPARRGSHVSFSLKDAYQIDQALINEFNVIPDFRAPDVIRFGVTPLYTRYGEAVDAVQRMNEAIQSGAASRYRPRGQAVT